MVWVTWKKSKLFLNPKYNNDDDEDEGNDDE